MTIKKTICALALIGFGITTVHAGPIFIDGGEFDGTDVGNLDRHIADANGHNDADGPDNSGKQAETDWVNDVLETQFTKSDMNKSENVGAFSTTEDNVIAFALASGPGYYLIKNAKFHVLFENVSSFDWGVIDLANLDDGMNLNSNDARSGLRISHVSSFGEGGSEIPSPGTLALLGVGLISAALMRVRYRGKNPVGRAT